MLTLAAVGVGTLVRTGPTHVLSTPDKIGAYQRRPLLEQQMSATDLQKELMSKSAGQVSHVVSAVYEQSGNTSGAADAHIVLFIGGNLSGVSPSGFMTSFRQQFAGAQSTSPGSMGGRAECANEKSGGSGSVALCAWVDNDTFGLVTSPTMNAAELAAQMRALRPGIEHVAK